MASKIDQSGDVNLVETNRLNAMYGFPEYVKQASVQAVCSPPGDSPTMFADPVSHQFPVHSKAATLVSHMFFLANEDQVNPKLRPLIRGRLDKMAVYWGIGGDVEAVRVKHAQMQKDAVPDSRYAIVIASDNGVKDRRYPLRNAMEVKAAAQWFENHLDSLRTEFLFTDRQIIARNILRKAGEYGADIGDYTETLQKSAGMGVGSPSKIAAAIRNRVKAADRVKPGLAVLFEALANKVASQPRAFLDPDTATKLATTIETFDRETHLLNKYSPGLPSVEDALFDVTHEKLASIHANSCQTLTGSVYTTDQFSKLSFSDVKDLFGDDIANEVCTGLGIDPAKFAEVATTLPRPDAISLDTMMADKGLHPLMVTSY